MKAKRLLLVLLFLLVGAPALFAQLARPRGDRPDLNAINGQIYFSDMFPGATTVAHIQYIINATLGPVWIIVPPAETGNAGDFAGVVLLRANVVVIDLRQGVLTYGFKNPVANTVIAQSSAASPTGWVLRQLTSQTANAATAGWLRLASADVVNFRNNANTADVNGLAKNATDVVQVGNVAGVRLAAAAATPILNYLSATTALNAAAPGAVPGCSADLVVAVAGAALGDSVAIGVSTTLPATYSLTGFVSAAGSVSVRWCQFSGVAADPDGAGATYRASVIQH